MKLPKLGDFSQTNQSDAYLKDFKMDYEHWLDEAAKTRTKFEHMFNGDPKYLPHFKPLFEYYRNQLLKTINFPWDDRTDKQVQEMKRLINNEVDELSKYI